MSGCAAPGGRIALLHGAVIADILSAGFGPMTSSERRSIEILVDNGTIASVLQLVPMEAENEKKRFFQKGWNRISNFGFSSSSCSRPDPTRVGAFAETRRATRQPFRHPAAGYL